MRKKLYITIIFCLLFGTLLSQNSFAKYVIQDTLQMSVYIDKTPPTINVITNGETESFTKNQTDIVKRMQDITVNTDDNIKIKTNKCYYNPTQPNFEGLESDNFEGDKKIADEGYYKIVATDTSENMTEIIILIDKTPPDVTVKFYKKSEEPKVSNSKQVLVAGTTRHLKTENILDIVENEKEEIIQESVKEATQETAQENMQEVVQENTIKRAAARSTSYVTNETELRNALNNRITDIVTRGSINIGSTLDINYNVTISPATNENALRFGGYGNFFNVKNGATLTITSMVIDCASNCRNRDVTAIYVNSGASLVFNRNSIIDCGNNYGIVINGTGKATMHSSTILGGKKGVIVKDAGSLIFGNDGYNNDWWGSVTALSFENFTGTCNINQSNVKLRNNTNGIIKESGNGTLNISAGEIYSNGSNGVIALSGNTNISGSTFYSNGNAINIGSANLNLTGGTIRNNTTGVLLSKNYSGKFKMTAGNINSNTQYAINHAQANDENCIIHGGTISGKVYLALDDNYVNTNDKYTSFEVTPSKYFFKRKLVKTNNNECANTEIAKVTLTKNGDWYKYINDDEYIVVWKGCNVRVNYTDYFGNVIETELKTGNLDETYETTPKELEGYDLIEIPKNQTGKFTEKDIVVTYKYDIKNIAIVNYEDLLSGVVSAKYWYNANSESFAGNGTDFTDGTIFEKYGFYKVLVTNGVGLQKELTFHLNKDSIKR